MVQVVHFIFFREGVCVLSHQSCLTLCNTMEQRLLQAPLSMRFSRQEYWSGLPFPPPGDLPKPGTEPKSPAWAGGFFTTSATREGCGSVGHLYHSDNPEFYKKAISWSTKANDTYFYFRSFVTSLWEANTAAVIPTLLMKKTVAHALRKWQLDTKNNHTVRVLGRELWVWCFILIELEMSDHTVNLSSMQVPN